MLTWSCCSWFPKDRHRRKESFESESALRGKARLLARKLQIRAHPLLSSVFHHPSFLFDMPFTPSDLAKIIGITSGPDGHHSNLPSQQQIQSMRKTVSPSDLQFVPSTPF